MRSFAKLAAVLVTTTATIPMWVASAAAENCLTVENNGICSMETSTVGGISVGGPTPVTTPPVAVVAPADICYFLGCIPEGETVVLVPGMTQTVPLPGPVPVPLVEVPDGWEIRLDGATIRLRDCEYSPYDIRTFGDETRVYVCDRLIVAVPVTV